MNGKKYKEHTNSETNKPDKEELWKNFQIDFLRVARIFPDNKVHAMVRIKPNEARKLIQKFELIVNGQKRDEFEATYDEISISGFDIKKDKKDKKVNIKIQAIPFDPNWKTIRKESKPCDFYFTDEILSLSPVINFEWIDDDSNVNVNVIVKWHHVDDQSVQKYVVCLDNKEIHYVDHRSFSRELETCIHYLKPGEEHTVQIISKLSNGKEKHRSDLIRFTVPAENDAPMSEVLNVCDERVPSKLLAYIEVEEEEEKPSLPDLHQYKERVLELLQKLQDQIEKRKVN